MRRAFIASPIFPSRRAIKIPLTPRRPTNTHTFRRFAMVSTTPHQAKTTRFPAVYVNHGGGPMPLLGKQPAVADSFRDIAASLPRPRAVVIISAHFETSVTTILTAESPGLLFDYNGFAPEAYRFKYPARPDSDVIARIQNLLAKVNIPFRTDTERGMDHGVFVPLMLMYPDADIPVICVSQPSDYNPDSVWALGSALAPLRDEGILVLGSGASFHNFSAFFRRPGDPKKAEDVKQSKEWDTWLRETVACAPAEREKRLREWFHGPHARFAHPEEDHLMPLLAVAAASGSDPGNATREQNMAGLSVSSFVFGTT